MSDKKKGFKEVYTFRIDPKLMATLKLYALANDTTQSNLIRDALLSYGPLKKYFTKVG